MDIDDVIKIVDNHTKDDSSEIVLDEDISVILEEVPTAYDKYKMCFNKMELNSIKFALDYLHDADLSNLPKSDIKNIENLMVKLNMTFDSQLD